MRSIRGSRRNNRGEKHANVPYQDNADPSKETRQDNGATR
jgi:hypothetical protein